MSAIQFNLLPDVKTKYIAAERNRKTITTVAILASLASLALFLIMLFSVNVVQKAQLSSADKQAKDAVTQLKNISGLGQIVTVQNQLQTLATLHQGEQAPVRLFTYLPQLTPSQASIGSVSLDMTADTLNINGTADSQATVNEFVDTLKYATYKADASDSEHPAFSNVLLVSFSVTPGKAGYSISTNFDPALFSNPLQAAPILVVKNQVTTRSVQDDPSNLLFNGQTTTKAAK